MSEILARALRCALSTVSIRRDLDFRARILAGAAGVPVWFAHRYVQRAYEDGAEEPRPADLSAMWAMSRSRTRAPW